MKNFLAQYLTDKGILAHVQDYLYANDIVFSAPNVPVIYFLASRSRLNRHDCGATFGKVTGAFNMRVDIDERFRGWFDDSPFDTRQELVDDAGHAIGYYSNNIYVFPWITSVTEKTPLAEAFCGFVATQIEENNKKLEVLKRERLQEELVVALARSSLQRVEVLKTQIASNRRALEDTLRAVPGYVTKLREDKQLLSALENSNEDKDLISSISKGLYQLIPATYESIILVPGYGADPDCVTMRTQPISFVVDGDTYTIGTYAVTVDLVRFNVTVNSVTAERESAGHIHPHISEDLAVCWGEFIDPLSDMMERRDVVSLFVYAHQFLGTYNAEDSYAPLSNWFPELEEVNYEECFDNSAQDGYIECISCGDDNCPHLVDRYTNCWDEILNRDSFKDCVRCNTCDNAQEAMRLCHQQQVDDAEPFTCVRRCSHSWCSYCADSQACWGSHEDFEICRDCEDAYCAYYEKMLAFDAENDVEEPEDVDNEDDPSNGEW